MKALLLVLAAAAAAAHPYTIAGVVQNPEGHPQTPSPPSKIARDRRP